MSAVGTRGVIPAIPSKPRSDTKNYSPYHLAAPEPIRGKRKSWKKKRRSNEDISSSAQREDVGESGKRGDKEIHSRDDSGETSTSKRRVQGEDIGGKEKRQKFNASPFHSHPHRTSNFYNKSSLHMGTSVNPRSKIHPSTTPSRPSNIVGGNLESTKTTVPPKAAVVGSVSEKKREGKEKRKAERCKEMDLIMERIKDLETQVERNKQEIELRDKVR